MVRRRAEAHDIEQRYPTAKRVLLGPVAPIARRWAMSGEPSRSKATAIRRLVVPPVGASAKDYVREVEPGFLYAGNTQDLLGLLVYIFGVWEPNLSAFLKSRLGPGDTFIDVGANSGWFTSMGAALVGPTGHVTGVEASPIIAARLQANLDRNGFNNTRVLVAAAMAGPGVVDIIPGPAEHTGLTRVETADAHGGAEGVIRVRGDALPSLLTPEEIARARVVKIDVEGAEFDVIAGLGPTLDRFHPECEFVVEVGPERAGDDAAVAALIATFANAGLRPYALPNYYDVRSYMLAEPVRELQPVTAPPTRELDIVFSRLGGETLLI